MHELNQLELQFLLLNDFKLMISLEEMQRYADQLLLYGSGSRGASADADGDGDNGREPPAAAELGGGGGGGGHRGPHRRGRHHRLPRYRLRRPLRALNSSGFPSFS